MFYSANGNHARIESAGVLRRNMLGKALLHKRNRRGKKPSPCVLSMDGCMEAARFC